MAFSSNSYQQLGFGDSTLRLSEREKKILNSSWAGAFAQDIFPKIDEKMFAPLYSAGAGKPGNPVNVMIGAMILEELFDLSDDEIVGSLICDVRFQTALHTTSAAEQPLSARSMRRFRKKLNDDRKENDRNILHDCFWKFHGDLDAFIEQYFPSRKTDSVQIEHAILRTRAESDFDPRVIEDPETFKINVLPAHSDHTPYASEEEYRKAGNKRTENGEASTGFRYSLNGLWKFSYAKNRASAIPGFEKLSYDSRSWDEIRVPAHLQMEGYDHPQYVNIQYPWDGSEALKPGQVPKEFNPVGSYVKYFYVPEGWEGRPVYISFQGVESGYAVWLNGNFVGYSEDTFTPSDFDLTPFLMEGENKLAVQVYKWTSSSWLEDQDFYRFSGIFRDVYLYTVPEIHVRDLKIRTLLNAECTDAELVVDLALQAEESGSIRYRLEKGGREILAGEQKAKARNLNASPATGIHHNSSDSADNEKKDARKENSADRADRETEEEEKRDLLIQLREKVQAPALWSAEDPQLYDLYLTVLDKDGKEIEFIAEKVGFRRFEMKDGLMCLNGKRIVFKGVNRHEFSCDAGRAGMSEELMRQDLVLMKRNNINAIRTCHYPDDSKLYRLCDEYGIYMIAENNMETHGTWGAYEAGQTDVEDIIPRDHKEWEPVLLDRVNSCYQRDKNHPAILIWSCGNESFGGSVIFAMSEKFRELDPDRLVHYEGIFHDRRFPETSDMESQMYPSADNIRKFLAEHPEKPFLCCEYSHSMGNSNGGLFKYTELSEEEPRYQGGFIWDFVDQSLRKKDRYGVEFQAYGGDCLERPTDYSFSGNGLVAGDRMPYPKLQEVKFLYQNISVRVGRDQFLVINRNLMVNTDRFDCFAVLEREGVKLEEKKVETKVPPLSQKAYLLPFALPEEGGEYAVTVSFRLKEKTLWADAGYEVAFGQGVFQIPAEGVGGQLNDTVTGTGGDSSSQDVSKEGVNANSGTPGILVSQDKSIAHVVPGTYGIGIHGLDFDALFGFLNESGLKSYRYGGKELVILPPRPNFWRAPTDNDKGNRMAARYGIWKICSDYASDTRAEGAMSETPEERQGTISAEQDRNVFVIRQRLFLPTVQTGEKKLHVTYRFHGNGTIDFVLDYDADGTLPPMPEFGMLFTMDADYDRVTWYGNGPDETYCDRDKGAKLGVYSGTVKEQMTRYLVPQECGNKTGVRWAKVTDRLGRGILFSVPVGQAMNFSALPWTPDEIENAAHHTELPPIHHTTVRCSLMQMGVAGDDSWGARTLPEFLLKNEGHLHFEVSMKGI